MRFHRILAIAGTFFALASVSACGSLPSAGSPQEAGDFLKSTLSCASIDIASPREVQRVEAMGMTGINGGGECQDPAGGDGDADFLTIEDMEAFQTAVKGDEDEQDDLMIGDDFAVDPGSDDQRRQLLKAGLLFLNCTSDFKAPSGRTAEEGAVEGCATTDYSEDLD
ncbi:hypothetical protein [Streptomyces decoyicus]|uniref:hypothetical protein n=1 Tax=Streptomyces decoyicus TaxID=249567 RepID=UPI002E37FB7C|nr:hypothetical protein [Streptomyces decoyicus]